MGDVFKGFTRYTQTKHKGYYIIVSIILFVMMMNVFMGNVFSEFETFSENLTTSMVVAGKEHLDIEDRQFGLGRISTQSSNDPYQIYYNPSFLDTGYEISEYPSQIGLQGWAAYKIAQVLPKPYKVLKFSCCFFLVLILCLICYQLLILYGPLLAGSFYFVSLASPIMSQFASNLYWVEFTWFLPMLLGLLCLKHLEKAYYLYPFVFLSVFIKCACGYEYISVVMLGTILFLVVEWLDTFGHKDHIDLKRRKLLFKSIIINGGLSLLAFASALTIHAHLRGDGNLRIGLNTIYVEDVLRRTYGDASDYVSTLSDSLNATVFDVLKKYFIVDDIQMYSMIQIILLASLVGVSIIFIKNRKNNLLDKKDFYLYIVSLLASLSWFVLAKSHSFVHVSQNIVVWYMGYLQISIYILAKYMIKKRQLQI